MRGWFPKAMWTHVVVKRNKRLFIGRLETGDTVYTPPDFIRPHMKSRDQLKVLAEKLTAGESYIDAVVAFESGVLPAAPTLVGAA